MRTVIAYNAARIGLFLAVAGVLYLLGARGLLLLASAVVISGLISFVALSRQRDAMSEVITTRIARARDRFAQAQAREDPSEADPGGETRDARDADGRKPGERGPVDADPADGKARGSTGRYPGGGTRA
jgi:hypothetical protein